MLNSVSSGFNLPTGGRLPIIDCDIDPQIPRDLKLVEHLKGGQVEFDPTKLVIYQDDIQKSGGIVTAGQLIAQLRGRRKLANANMLDWLLEHPEMIPEAWAEPKSGSTPTIFFLDTLYRLYDQFNVVRYLRCYIAPDGKTWGSGSDAIDNPWYEDSWVVIFED